MRTKLMLVLTAYCVLACTSHNTDQARTAKTYCNPVDISYRFGLENPSRREAADPTIVKFKGLYYLFASKSGGYWHSPDLHTWTFVDATEIPTEEYAPTAVAIGDTLYFLASSNEKSTIYKTSDPLTGHWSVAREALDRPVWDPAFFLDDDQRLYLYWGCSNVNPLYGVELDYRKGFTFVGQPKEILYPNPAQNGWEVPGDYNSILTQQPWIEGAWVNKHNGTYYLQYSGPGTEYKSYSNGVYVSDQPLGPYTCAPHNPFSYRPEGFIAGAGHGSTITDAFGNFWNMSTGTISVKQIFERRLVLYPAFIDDRGTMYANTKFGDYPMNVPNRKVTGFNDLFTGWMLLSYQKPVQVSSSVDSLPARNLTDENIRTYWAATSGKPGEYAIIDLEKICDVYALQINFAEHDTKLLGRKTATYHRYTLAYSDDQTTWRMLIDRSGNMTDNTHVYIPLPERISCRYIRLMNVEVPDGNVALSDLRIFGISNEAFPQAVTGLRVTRNAENSRSVTLRWNKVPDAVGYNISYGIDSARLYHNYLVYTDTLLTLNSLNSTQKYYFTVESFNSRGITPTRELVQIP